MARMRRPHLDSESIAEAVEGFVEGRTATHVANASTAGVVHPANASYTQADQTALANAVVSLGTQLNAALAALQAAGLMASS